MFSKILFLANQLDFFFWGYVSFLLISCLGIYFTIQSRAFQVRSLFSIIATFFSCFSNASSQEGIHPLRLFFSSVGGMVGIGNVVGIVTAVQFGGPGAVFWVFWTGIIGSIIKYAEVYLGLKYRRLNRDTFGYDGGPVHIFQNAFKKGFFSFFLSLLFCVYCIDVYQFSVIVESINVNYHLDKTLVLCILLPLILFVVLGGVERVTRYAFFLNPIIIMTYLILALFFISLHLDQLPALLRTILTSAFTGHAAIGGFAGSSLLTGIRFGVSRAFYSGDIGMGYDASIQSESKLVEAEKQARLAVFGVYLDNFICILTLLVVLLSGTWMADPPVKSTLLVQKVLENRFPGVMHLFPFFFFFAGFISVASYFSVGLKTATQFFNRFGKWLYFVYGMVIFPVFAFVDGEYALLFMSLSAGILLCMNLLSIFKLRKEVLFFEEEEREEIESILEENA